MDNIANAVLDHLGGTSATAKMLEAPVSTVHSWRVNGIPLSRMAHLRLAARAAGASLPDDLNDLLHAPANAAAQQDGSSGNDRAHSTSDARVL